MRIRQGAFSHIDELTDDEIKAQIQYMLDNKWAVSVEFTDDPHPRSVYWEMWGLPMFDLDEASAIMMEVTACRKAYPNHYIKVNGYDSRLTKQTTGLNFIVNRPEVEPGFRLDRTETNDRHVEYTLHSYAGDKPHGMRYGGDSPD